MKTKRGQKLCASCNTINGVRSFECKNCGEQFKMKKGRKGARKKKVQDFKTLKKNDIIRVVGGSGCYHTDRNGDKHYFTDRGKYRVDSIDNKGINVYGGCGYYYLYMGKKCTSKLLDSITHAPHKIVLIQEGITQTTVAPKRRRSANRR